MTADKNTRTRWLPWRSCLGIAIVLGVLAGWELGRSISDPGVLVLLGIACSLLSVNIYVNMPRSGGSTSMPSSSEQPSDSSERPSPATYNAND